MIKLNTLFRTATLSAGVLFCAFSAADDTDIFFSQSVSDDQVRPNVMLMLDTSGSMSEPSGSGIHGESRLDAIRNATIDLVNTIENVNVGVGAFAGSGIGGAILYPSGDLDTDVCIDASCDTVFTKHKVNDPNDDAQQFPSGEVDRDRFLLDLGSSVPDEDLEVRRSHPDAAADDAEEKADGTLLLNNDSHKLFYSADGNRSHVGYRFIGVSVPPGAEIYQARLGFFTADTTNVGDVGVTIKIDATPDSPEFADAPGRKVSNRPTLPETVVWDNIQRHTDVGRETTSPDITDMVRARIAQPDWTAGHPMTFILEPLAGETIDANNMRSFTSATSENIPWLEISYSITPRVENQVAMRFDSVQIPRGATLKSAKLKMFAIRTNNIPGNLIVKAEAIGNSPPILGTDNNISSRTPTGAAVTWEPEAFVVREIYRVDIDPVINEVINRTDWCGGNALTLIVDGPGFRSIRSIEDGASRAPELEISYDPGSVDFNDTCLSSRASFSIASSGDDAQEDLPTGVVTRTDKSLATQSNSNRNLLGFRFNNLSIPKNASILSATLKLQSEGYSGAPINATIYGDRTADSAIFNSLVTRNLSTRGSTIATVDWSNIPQSESDIVSSPDVSKIIEEIVSMPGWASGNSLSLMIDPSSAAGQYLFGSHDSDASSPPQLQIEYQLDETDLQGTPVTLRTARDELIDVLNGLPTHGGTPLVDSLYEAGLYFRNDPVHFGTTRGEAQEDDIASRLSHERAYIGGSLFRPPGCSELDLNNVACIDEEILGNPVYRAPDAASCLSNNIVLLTDGDAAGNNSKELVQALPGIGKCSARTIEDEECGIELADWLNNTDQNPSLPGIQRTKVHTIGFSHSSSFLSDLAKSGDGQNHTVDDANALKDAFSQITREASDINTSFVAPSVSVSQLSSLSNSSEIYYAMFKPQVTARWDGNLKRYAIGTVNGDTAVVDALGQAAIDPATGAISETTQSYWSGQQDGEVVAEGGAAGELTLPRNVYTFKPGATGVGSLEDLHENNNYLSAAVLGLTDASYRTQLLRWARGVDINDMDDDGNVNEVRTQMGDPLHSAPYINHYATGNGTKSLIFVGTNEGYLHAIDAESGREEYAIVPPQLLPNLDVFYNNQSVEASDRPYGLDGDVVGWTEDANDNRIIDPGEKSYVVVGMRRGGHSYYAFDVSNPSNPTVAWTIHNTDPGFAELGETWSRPVQTRLKNYGVETDVLIFSGGYDDVNDLREERDDLSLTDTKGRAIFIVNAKTGALLRKFDQSDSNDMNYSIPSSPRVVDINLDGLADYLFVGDMGGQIWRLDFDNLSTDSLNATVTGGVIADFSGAANNANRRFFYEPDVSVLSGETGERYLNIAIGSGWRAQPLDQVVDDRMYVFRNSSVFGPPRNENGQISYTKIGESDLFDATLSDTSSDTSNNSETGFFIRLEGSGEKIVSTAFTINSNVLFSSYLPQENIAGSCQASVGSSNFYAIDALTAKAVLNLDGSDQSSDLSISDRKVKLRTPGIAAGPSVLITEQGEVMVVVGLEEPEGSNGLDIGNRFQRTFWAESFEDD